MNKVPLAAIALSLVVLSSCSRRPAQSEEAVRQAIERYLTSRPNLNMQGMDMQVSAVRFREGQAEADVVFRAKGDAKATLSMHYNLKRQGNGWAVVPQAGGHGGVMPSTGTSEMGDLPAGHPPTGAAPPASPELPSGHPPAGTTTPATAPPAKSP